MGKRIDGGLFEYERSGFMKAVTVAYVYPSARVSFVAFGNETQVGSVYGITYMSNGFVYINTAEYPFHYELANTELTVFDEGVERTIYTTEVN